MTTDYGLLGIIIGGLVAVAGMVWVALIQRRATPYDALSNRVLKLETKTVNQGRRVRMLEEDTDVLVDSLQEQSNWQETGSEPPPPPITDRALRVLRRHREERARLNAAALEHTD